MRLLQSRCRGMFSQFVRPPSPVEFLCLRTLYHYRKVVFLPAAATAVVNFVLFEFFGILFRRMRWSSVLVACALRAWAVRSFTVSSIGPAFFERGSLLFPVLPCIIHQLGPRRHCLHTLYHLRTRTPLLSTVCPWWTFHHCRLSNALPCRPAVFKFYLFVDGLPLSLMSWPIGSLATIDSSWTVLHTLSLSCTVRTSFPPRRFS